MKLPSPTEQFLSALDFLKRGIRRWRVVTCWSCGQKNRIDVWRLLMMKVGARANCGACKQNLMRAVKA